jgi:CMP-N,N'-diacetyllegionaminic acid synthase
MSNIAIILARGGSKGIPKKNIKIFCGKPLIYWSIKQAIDSGIFDKVVVSTDCKKIRDISIESGAEAPFLRPSNLATDQSPSIDSVIHCLDYYQNKNVSFNNVCLLEPTSPLRSPGQLKSISDNFNKLSKEYDSLITIGELGESAELLKIIKGNSLEPSFSSVHSSQRRQDLSVHYFPYGVAYFIKAKVLRSERTFYAKKCTYFILEPNQCYEIDTPLDFEINEYLFEKYYYNSQY